MSSRTANPALRLREGPAEALSAHARIPAALAAVVVVLFLAGLPVAAEAAKEPAKPQGWLGVTVGPASAPEARDAADYPAGVPVEGVVADSPARRAGLRARDRILAVDGKAVSSASELISLVKASAPDGYVTLSVRRGKRTLELKAFLEARPENAGSLRMLEGWIGVEAIDLPPDLREFFGAPREAGVMISRVVAGSPAESAGLTLGDVVFDVEGDPIRSAPGLASAVTRGGVDNRLQVRLMRNGAEITVEPLVAPKPDKDQRPERD